MYGCSVVLGKAFTGVFSAILLFVPSPVRAEIGYARSDASANENAIRNALSQSLSFPVPLDKGNVDSGNEIDPSKALFPAHLPRMRYSLCSNDGSVPRTVLGPLYKLPFLISVKHST